MIYFLYLIFSVSQKPSVMIDNSIYKAAPPYYHPYFDLIQSNDLILELEKSKETTQKLFLSIKDENYAYAENKWSIKEVLQHIIDCERIYAYRALRFSRLDPTELAGFEENDYISNIKPLQNNLNDLLSEYQDVRNSTIKLFQPMTDKMLDFKGTANQFSLSARVLGFMTIGHNLHHCHSIESRYLMKS